MTLPTTPPSGSSENSIWQTWREHGIARLSGSTAIVGMVGLAIVGGLGLWLRFASTSLLWLDEALSVNIAELPVSQIPSALKRDGAPPLYYVILHFWMGAFGSSDLAVRSLSGVVSVLAILGAFLLARRVWGLETGLIAAGILAASGFATYYANETRMYALVMLLVVALGWCLVLLAERPSIPRLIALAIASSALLYTHYWGLFFLGAIGAWLVLTVMRGDSWRRFGTFGLGALVMSAVAFIPWLPIFRFQSAHTGTPWAKPPDLQIALTGVLHFYDNQGALPTPAGPDLALLQLFTVALVVLGVFGVAKGRRRIVIDLAGRPKGRFLAWVIFGTLALGIVGAHISQSTFVPRYAAVILVPLVILMAVGTQAIAAPWLRLVAIGILALGLVVQGLEWRTTQRSQGGEISSVLLKNAKPGDTVLFCPDQLGPSVIRILPGNELSLYGYPRLDNPRFINWVDYLAAMRSTSPKKFAKQVSAKTGRHTVWLVWATGYGPYQSTCAVLASTFLTLPGWGAHQWVDAHQWRYFQSMNLTQFNPPDHRPGR